MRDVEEDAELSVHKVVMAAAEFFKKNKKLKMK
jgi:hypothetical protein